MIRATLWNTKMALMIQTIRSHFSWYSQGECLLCRLSYFYLVFPSGGKTGSPVLGPPLLCRFWAIQVCRLGTRLSVAENCWDCEPQKVSLLLDQFWDSLTSHDDTDLIQSLMSPDFPLSVRRLVTRGRGFHYNGSTKLVVVYPPFLLYIHTLIPISRGIFPPLLPPARDWYT